VASPIVTPEAVVLDFDTAGVATRVLARLVDVLFVAFLASLLTSTFIPVLAGLGAGEAGFVLAAFLTVFGYPAVCETIWGATPGKSALGLRVITEEGGPVGFRHAAIRSAMQVVDILLIPIGVLAVGSTLAGRRDQRLGDRLAGTLVIRSASVSMRSRAMGFPPLPGYEGYVAGLDVGQLSSERYEVLRSFLTRVDELTPDARRHLAHRLAGPTGAMLGHARPTWISDEAFLASVAAAYQQRHGGPATWMWGPRGPAPAPGFHRA
jgi:uncharacterized RDD family membrane protein YckC